MSKTVSKNVTDNLTKKWEKKLRNAKTQEQVEKAESMLVLRPKEKVVKVLMTDDQLMDQVIKENMKKKKFYEEKESEEKKKSLET